MKTIDADHYAYLLDQIIQEHEDQAMKSKEGLMMHELAVATGLRKAKRMIDMMPVVERVNQNLIDDVKRYVEEHWDGTEESIPCEQA